MCIYIHTCIYSRPRQNRYSKDDYNSNELEELRRKQETNVNQLEELLEEPRRASSQPFCRSIGGCDKLPRRCLV